MDGKDLFLLWWLFLDVNNTCNLRVLISHPSYRKFNHELVGFLANNQVKAVTKCTLRYNWILKDDYIAAFSTNMPKLRHIVFYCDPPTDDLLIILAENCQELWKLEFMGNLNHEFHENDEVSNQCKRASFASSKGKLSYTGYRTFFEKQIYLREIDLVQIEKELGKKGLYLSDWLVSTRDAPKYQEYERDLKPFFDPLKEMKQLSTVIVTHNYVDAIESLPQVKHVELRLTQGKHPIQELGLLQNKPILHLHTASNEHSSSRIPLNNLLLTDMNKLVKLRLEDKFSGMKKLTLELRIFAAVKDIEEPGFLLEEEEIENPNSLALGIINTSYAPASINTVIKQLPLSLHVRFSVFPCLLKLEGMGFNSNCIPLFRSFDTFFMESLSAFNTAEVIEMTHGAPETSWQFRNAWRNILNSFGNEVSLGEEDQEDDWGDWRFGLKSYMNNNGQKIEGHAFTNVTFQNLSHLELNFGDSRQPSMQPSMRFAPPISHDLFCQLFFLSNSLRKLKLTIPGRIAKFNEKDFIKKCNTAYGRQRLSKLSHISLWFSNVRIQNPGLHELSTTILSICGFLSLLKVCSSEKSLESMLWFNLSGDNEKRFLREYETEGNYLPCVTHLLNRCVPMVAVHKSHESKAGIGWVCSDLRRVARITA